MRGRFVLDTNIFVYSFDRSVAGKSRRGTRLIRKALNTLKGITSDQIVQEFFSVVSQCFARPIKAAEVTGLGSKDENGGGTLAGRAGSLRTRVLSRPNRVCFVGYTRPAHELPKPHTDATQRAGCQG